MQGYAGSHGISEEIGILDIELLEKSNCIVCHLLYAQRAIGIGYVPIGLLFDGDDLPGLLKKGRNFLKEVSVADKVP